MRSHFHFKLFQETLPLEPQYNGFSIVIKAISSVSIILYHRRSKGFKNLILTSTHFPMLFNCIQGKPSCFTHYIKVFNSQISRGLHDLHYYNVGTNRYILVILQVDDGPIYHSSDSASHDMIANQDIASYALQELQWSKFVYYNLSAFLDQMRSISPKMDTRVA